MAASHFDTGEVCGVAGEQGNVQGQGGGGDPVIGTLAHVGAEVELAVKGSATQRSVLDALESRN